MVFPRSIVLAAVVVLVAAACTPGGGEPPATTGDEAWRTTELVDTRTGESFSIAGLGGKLVALEPMAVWCSTCRTQQFEAKDALAQLGDPDIIYISIGVDPNERPEDLARYADRWGFDWRFVVAPTDVARSLARTFGDQVLSPPSTPLILVGPDGSVVASQFGIHGAADLVALFSEHRS